MDDDEWEMNMWMAGAIAAAGIALEAEEEENNMSVSVVDHRKLPRAKRTVYKHQEALYAIKRDYLGPSPIFDGREFDKMFRISKARFERIMMDLILSGDPFYQQNRDCT
jgi:hypothetical protein